MASDKSLAAEIEAVKLALHQRLPIDDDLADDAAKHIVRTVIAPRLAEIAALQSRAFEGGARGPFRVVRRVPRNVYRGDALVFIAATEHEAAEMVALLNAGCAALAE